MKWPAAILAGVGISTIERWCASGKLTEVWKVGRRGVARQEKLYRLADVLLLRENDWR